MLDNPDSGVARYDYVVWQDREVKFDITNM